jgi:hypothetical protein
VRALLRYSYSWLRGSDRERGRGLLLFDPVIRLTGIAVDPWRRAEARGLSMAHIAIGAGLGVAGPLLYCCGGRREASLEDALRSAPMVLLPTLAVFTAATLFAIHRYGYLSFLFFAAANEATQLLFVDLTSASRSSPSGWSGTRVLEGRRTSPFSLSRSFSARLDRSRTSSPADGDDRGSDSSEPSPWRRERSR